jgi:phosphoserine phosphatase
MKIAFDIDDTLWKIRIRNVDGRAVGDQVPDYSLIAVLRWFFENGDEIYVWSAGGTLYAQQIVDKLGLSEMVMVIPKEENPRLIPDLTFDDEAIMIGITNCKVRRPDHEKIVAEITAQENHS